MQTTNFLLSQTNFFVYIKRENNLGTGVCFALETIAFVPRIKQYVFEMCSEVPP